MLVHSKALFAALLALRLIVDDGHQISDANNDQCGDGWRSEYYFKYATPTKDIEIEQYIMHLDRTRQKLDVAQALYKLGCHSLENTFWEILREEGRLAYKTTDLYDCISDGFDPVLREDKLHALPDNVIDPLAKIASWLEENSGNSDIVSAYALYRSDIVADVLKRMRVEQHSNGLPAEFPDDEYIVNRRHAPFSGKRNESRSKRSGHFAESAATLGATATEPNITKEAIDKVSQTFLLLLASICLLFEVESKYVNRILGEKYANVAMKLIIDQALQDVVKFGEDVYTSVLDYMDQTVEKDMTVVKTLLHVTGFVSRNSVKLNEILKGLPSDRRWLYKIVMNWFSDLIKMYQEP